MSPGETEIALGKGSLDCLPLEMSQKELQVLKGGRCVQSSEPFLQAKAYNVLVRTRKGLGEAERHQKQKNEDRRVEGR